MIAIPARVSPIPSLPYALPGSPIRSAAPAVVLRQAVEPAALATPAVTIQSTTAAATPRHSPSQSYSPAYYSPPRTVVATPAAVVHDYHLTHRDHHHSSHGSRTIQHQPQGVAVAAHTVESSLQHYAYCDHHAPAAIAHKTAAVTRHMADAQQHYTPVVYAQPAVTASPRHSPQQQPQQLVYQPPSPPTAHYQLVYQPAPALPTHVYTTEPPAAGQYYPAGMQYGVAVPKPSLSPPHKPLLHRPTAMAPPLSLSTGVGSAFTRVQPIAMYPTTRILIQ